MNLHFPFSRIAFKAINAVAIADLAQRLRRELHHRLRGPHFMYVKVPDPMPMAWLVKYSILTYLVPSVVSTFTSKTMMDP